MEIPVHSRAAIALLEIFESGRPLVYVRSAEEGRVADLLRNAGRQLRASKPLPVWTWSLTEGLSSDERRAQAGGHDLGNAAEARAQDPSIGLRWEVTSLLRHEGRDKLDLV